MQTINLTHHFLIAMPNLVDPYFARTLIYICQHNDQGALGIVINRPLDLSLGDLFAQINLPLDDENLATMPVYYGGPVQMERGFVLHQPLGEWMSSLAMNDAIGLTTSKDILEAVAAGVGPERFMVSLGYAGWETGQLERELAQNAWLSVPALPSIVFETPPAERLEAALAQLGINPFMLSGDAGHA